MNKFSAILSIYIGGLLIGLVLVSFPASSAYLVDKLSLSAEQYGSIYLPQLVFAIAGALGGGTAIRFMKTKSMYVLSLFCFFLSQVALAASIKADPSIALYLLMAATGLFGFGFGFGGGPVNGFAATIFSKHSNSAITMLHVFAGLGLALGPILFSRAISSHNWLLIPNTLAVVALALTVLTVFTRLPEQSQSSQEVDVTPPSKSAYFWLIMVVAVFYALAEGTFTSWAVIYAQESKGLAPEISGTALASFYVAFTIGRLIASALLIKVRAYALWLIFPPLMVVALFMLPIVAGGTQVILAFAFAGLACSAFFPLMIAVTAEPFPNSVSYIGSMLTAALMFGVGIGSYVIGRYRDVVSLDDLYLYSMIYPVLAFVFILIARTRLKKQKT